MIRSILLAAAALPAFTIPSATPLAAQSQQEQLEARYDRALAAGYKALFLCSAIANAERNGVTRTPESVMEWELTGIQPPLDGIVAKLQYTIHRDADGAVGHVEVSWAQDMPPRFAKAEWGSGCRLAPIGRRPILPEARRQRVSSEEAPVIEWEDRFEVSGAVSLRVEGAFEEGYGDRARTTAVLIRHNGTEADWYAAGFGEGTPQRTWSVAKSIASTLIGHAVHKGEADVTASTGLGTSRDDGRSAITIDNLLRMASGRYSDTPGNRTNPLYYGGATVEETAAHWPLVHQPGTVFRYANNDTLMAVKAIEDTFEDHPPADFFAKVGMDHTVAETDWQGDYILSSQVWSTARDLATMGQLYLNDGVLPSGERILPEGWVEYVSSPSGPQPEGRSWGYGAGFWLFNNHEGIPKDTFFAAGNRGQYVVIVPSRNIVIVRRGEDPTGSRFDIEAFTRDVLAALEE